MKIPEQKCTNIIIPPHQRQRNLNKDWTDTIEPILNISITNKWYHFKVSLFFSRLNTLYSIFLNSFLLNLLLIGTSRVGAFAVSTFSFYQRCWATFFMIIFFKTSQLFSDLKRDVCFKKWWNCKKNVRIELIFCLRFFWKLSPIAL